MLVHSGRLPAKTAEELSKRAKDTRTSFVAAVVGSGAMSAADLAHTVSATFALPLVDLAALDPSFMPSGLIEPKLATQYQVLPLSKRGSRLFIGTADPTDQEALDRIKFATQLSPEWIVVEHDKLMARLESMGTPTSEALETLVGDDFDFDVEDDVATPEKEEVGADVEDAPVVRFLQKMLVDAINMRASDLHFEPYESTYRVRFRVDGELREIAQPPIAIKDKLASRIKVISKLDISEKRVPQDGRMKLKFGNKAIDFRVSTLPTLFGEKIVIRILDPSSAKLGIDALGYEKDEKDRLLEAITRPYGMILVILAIGWLRHPNFISAGNIRQLIGGLNRDDFYDPTESTVNDFTIREDINAGYLMNTVDIDDWRFIAGMRYEGTEFEAKGTGATDGQFSATETKRRYHHWLPGLHTRYKLDRDTSLRAAWTNTVVRPNFDQLSPAITLASTTEATVGNPQLQPLRAHNLDLGVERLMGSDGAVSAYVFHKDIQDFTYATNLAGTGPWTGYTSVTGYANGAKARVQRARKRLREKLTTGCRVQLDGRGAVIDFVPRRVPGQ